MAAPRSPSSDCRSDVAVRNSEKATKDETSPAVVLSTSCACDVSLSSAAVRRAASSGSAACRSAKQRAGDGRKMSLSRVVLPRKMPMVACDSMAAKSTFCWPKRSSSARHSSSECSSAPARASKPRFSR
eukprot:scaffold1658_cov115-Isochrysis_galbana.AAC.14